MANVLVEETSLQNIANSIREKTGTEDTYKPSEMANAISGIETGGGSVQVEIQRYTPTDSESSHTFKHNLGVMPDFVFIYRNGNSTNHNNYIIEYGIGWKAKTSSDEDVPQGSHALYSKGYSMSKYAQLSWEYGLEDKIGMSNPINADTENIYLQADKYYSSTMLSGAEYILIAIAGVR